MSKPWTTPAILGGAIAAGVLGYVAYFDFQRRNSPEFRKSLRRRANKHAAQAQQAEKEVRTRERQALESVLDASLAESPLPTQPDQLKMFFIQEVGRAEELMNSGGAGAEEEAALAYYRALLAYPEPEVLLGQYEQVIKPASVLDRLRALVILRPPPALAAALGEAAAQTMGVD